MAVTRIWAVRNNLSQVVDYASNKNKTDLSKYSDLIDALHYAADDEIQVESYTKKLNEAILELNEKVPGAVYIIDDEEPGFLRAAVKLKNITFMILPPQSEETKKAQSENGKRNSKNLKNQKRT